MPQEEAMNEARNIYDKFLYIASPFQYNTREELTEHATRKALSTYVLCVAR